MENEFPNIPGFDFYPTDEQILDYLKQRNQDYFQGVSSSNAGIIRDIELYNSKPWDLPDLIERSTLGGSKRSEWYFFCLQKEKSSGRSSSRTVPNVGRRNVTSQKQNLHIGELRGTKLILNFKRSDRSSSGDGSTWVIHEYHINPSCLGYESINEMPFVACRLTRNA